MKKPRITKEQVLGTIYFIILMGGLIIGSSDVLAHPKWLEDELECLAANIYFEAGIEDHAGKIAVGLVTLNRVAADKWPDTICKVVKQPRQFSWYKESTKDIRPYPGRIWEESMLIAEFLMRYRHEIEDITRGALHYVNHALATDDEWAYSRNKLAEIGRHTFYD